MRTLSSNSTSTAVSWFQIVILVAALTSFAPTSRSKGRLWPAAINATHKVNSDAERSEFALFGMGCFWAHQSVFQNVPGVLRATTGYATVHTPSPDQASTTNGKEQRRQKPASYLSTCAGDGQTEAILVEYLPSILSYTDLLALFWQHHDDSSVTTERQQQDPLKRQHHHVRAQYQSVLWALTDDQRRLALESWEQQKNRSPSIVDTIVATTPITFFIAESVNQNFWSKVRLKLAFLFVGIVVSTTIANSIVWMDGLLVTDATVKVVLMWVLWEGLELVVRGMGSLCGRSLWPTERVQFG